MTEHTSTAIDLIFVNNLHSFVTHGVQEHAQSCKYLGVTMTEKWSWKLYI